MQVNIDSGPFLGKKIEKYNKNLAVSKAQQKFALRS